MKSGKSIFLAIVVVCLVWVSASSQTTTGRIRGVVKDPSGAVLAGAKVTVINKERSVFKTTQSSSQGEFLIGDLVPGNYKIEVASSGFKTLAYDNVTVALNDTTDLITQLQVGETTEVITVAAGGIELVDTTTTNLSKSFSGGQLTELAQTGLGGPGVGLGVNNLALLAPNVVSSGGVGVGMGGSVGGQRPRNNSFIVDGIDNNDKSITGPQVYVSPENVAEFSLLSNQFSAEYNRSNGGQFITITKSGTNQFHGSLFSYFRNRHLNALDTRQKNTGIIRERIAGREDDYNPRTDFARIGGNFGGPIVKDKFFFFGSYERSQGADAAPSIFIAPTAGGLNIIQSLSGISAANLEQFTKFMPIASSANLNPLSICRVRLVDGTCNQIASPSDPTKTIDDTIDIPVGRVRLPAAAFSNNDNYLLNLDYSQNDRTQHRFRFNYNNNSFIDNAASLPAFYINQPFKSTLFSYTLSHTFSPKISNETRLAYRRSESVFSSPDIEYPGLDAFPNLGLIDLEVDIGPNPNAPQRGIENNYQLVNNTSMLFGNHSVKFGADFRNIISPQEFIQRSRGDYQYGSFELYLRDFSPDALGERTVRGSAYYGNQKLFFPYIQDEWRLKPNFTLTLGLNYSYQEVPLSAKSQSLNSVSSVPGLIEFREPKAQTKNFAPKIGIAYSPAFENGVLKSLFGESGKSSIRAGFSMGYDYIFDNLYILSLPAQTTETRNVQSGQSNFIANGGIPKGAVGGTLTPAQARAATSAYIPDQQVPYSMSWSLSIQREIQKTWGVEFRYLGSRGVHLLTQSQLNSNALVSSKTGGLPTFLSNPGQSVLDSLTLTLEDLGTAFDNGGFLDSRYLNAGFENNFITSFLSNGNSSYNAFSAQLNRRFTNGLQLTSAYTFSKLIDDTTAEVFSTLLNPRRVQDFGDMRNERAVSALHRPQRLVFSGIYDLPFFKGGKGLSGKLLGGFKLAGTMTFESGQFVTVRSGKDSNLNGDSAGDRVIINPNGERDTVSLVTPLKNSAGNIVGYQAIDPTAYYIQAESGAIATAGRNTLQMPGINNLDFTIFKGFSITEGKKMEFQANLFNVFNHAQYTPGSVNQGISVATSAPTIGAVNLISSQTFNKPNQVFASNPRVIQLGLKFIF